MITLRLFTLPTCPNCPAAEKLVKRLERERTDVKVEILDMSDPDNYATALMLQIASTPSFVIDDTPIFVGEVPSLKELNKKIEECTKKS